MRLPILMMSAFLCAASASAETTIRFSNDWKWEGPAAPLLMALDRGWYKEVGLDVTMDTGKGSREAIPRVADGSNWQMGACDINSLIKFQDQNPDLAPVAVMMIYNAPPFRDHRPQVAGRDGAEGPRRQDPRRPGTGRRLRAVEGVREGERHRRLQGHHRERRLPGARAHARGGQGGRHHRLLVLVVHQPEGEGRGRGGHLAHPHARARSRPLRQRRHRQSGLREVQPGRGEGVRGGHGARVPGNGRRTPRARSSTC